MSKNIFITGATGFLGSYLMKEILDKSDDKIYALARDKDRTSFRMRIKNTLRELYPETNKEMQMRVIPLLGAIEKRQFGFKRPEIIWLAKEISEIYHCAAISDFNYSLNETRRVNVGGTENILKFALLCREYRNPVKVNHISTTYICGNRKKVFKETELHIKQVFKNTYEESKYEAEELVHKYRKKGLCAPIFRTSILSGDSITGRVANHKSIYQLIHILSIELFEELPADGMSVHNIIPVDYAAKIICLIARTNGTNCNKTYHVVSRNSIRFKDFLNLTSSYFGFKNPKLTPLSRFNFNALSPIQKQILKYHLEYLNCKSRFSYKNSEHALKRFGKKLPVLNRALLEKSFDYCTKARYLKVKCKAKHATTKR